MENYTNDLKVIKSQIVNCITNILKLNDTYTLEHSLRVATYATSFARFLGYTEHEVEILHNAALLHDIGKINICKSILNKPDKLSLVEQSIIKKHPLISYEIISGMSMFSQEAHVVLYHHERFDGCGYPSGFRGNEIDTTSMILIICDAFDAMTTDRPYRQAMTRSEAVDELYRNCNKQFDKELANLFIEFINNADDYYDNRGALYEMV